MGCSLLVLDTGRETPSVMSPSHSLLVPGAQHECGTPRSYSFLALCAEKERLGDITIGVSLLGSGTDKEPPVFVGSCAPSSVR